jgi:hypothetical protein
MARIADPPTSEWATSGPDPAAGDTTGLVVALGPELTGRTHLAYRRVPDRRWWRRRYPGRPIPEWDHVSLCGRQGLVEPETPRALECRSCRQIVASRRRRLERGTGTAEP